MSTKKPTQEAYTPIDCNYYDHIEATIVVRKKTLLKFIDKSGKAVSQTVRIKDTLTTSEGEFIILDSGEKIRMDAILELGEKENPKK